jgi:hypothetical protein
VQREFDHIKLVSEQVVEFNYRPTACRQTCRMVVVRKNLSVEQGERVLFDDVRYFFFISNEWVAEALAGEAPDGETLGPGAGVQDVRERLRAAAVPGTADGTTADVPGAVVEPAPADLLPAGRSVALLRRGPLKSASGCADPCWLQREAKVPVRAAETSLG